MALMSALVFSVLAIFGCDRKENAPAATTGAVKAPSAPTASAKKIAIILMQDDQFFRLNEAGMRATAKASGAELLVGNAYGKVDKEANLIDTYIAQGVGAILVSPIGPDTSGPALQRAKDKGIKVVLYNNAIKGDAVSFGITSDQTELGAATGREVKKYIETKLNGKANIAIIHFTSLSKEVGALRPDGFKKQIADLPGVKIVADQEAWLAPQATTTVESILAAHPELDLIWSANEGGTVGSVVAVGNANKAGKVAVFGTDISAQLAEFLLADDNILQAVTAQKPFEMGSQAMQAALDLLDNKEPAEKSVVLGGTLFSRNNPDEVKATLKKLKEDAK